MLFFLSILSVQYNLLLGQNSSACNFYNSCEECRSFKLCICANKLSTLSLVDPCGKEMENLGRAQLKSDTHSNVQMHSTLTTKVY